MRAHARRRAAPRATPRICQRMLSLATMVVVMPKAAFRTLQLPPSVQVPAGAVDHSSEPGGLCSGSLPPPTGGATCHRKVDHATTKVRMDVEFKC